MIPIIILGVAVCLFAGVFFMLMRANRSDAPGPRPRDQGRRDDDSNVVHSGRDVLKVIAITVAIMLGVLVIFCGTCMSGAQW